jgi:hypothetical protein
LPCLKASAGLRPMAPSYGALTLGRPLGARRRLASAEKAEKFTEGRVRDFTVEAPLVLGHEAFGVVKGLGPGVRRLDVGQKIAMEPGVPCGSCRACRIGRYNLCLDVRSFATPPIDGFSRATSCTMRTSVTSCRTTCLRRLEPSWSASLSVSGLHGRRE